MLKKYLIVVFVPLIICGWTMGQGNAAFTHDTWKGYERVNFKIDDHSAYYVKPSSPLQGNPWIWRASFPDWHTEMDSILLSKGVAVAYVSVDDQYGSAGAMQVWDKLYDYLVDSLSFAAKVNLEGVSRGGLYVYGWAKRNPDKVNVIYNEAPVCDIKSWPGGKGKGAGSKESWQQLLGVYKMTEKEALAFDDNPIDNLEGLASFKVPIIHVIGIDDKIVPSDENTNLLAQRYAALGGGPVIIDPVTTGPQELGGHHFPIKNAGRWADFIVANSYPVKPALNSNRFFNTRNGLKNAYRVFATEKHSTVAFLGGSITYNPGWRTKVCTYLKERFPGTDFHFIAAGIPSLGSLPHAFRVGRDILDSGKVDLLFVEAAVNDRGNGTDSLTQVRCLEGIIRHAKKSNPLMDIVMMSFADPLKNQDYDRGINPVEVINHELVADYYHLPSINLAREIYDKIGNNEFSWEYDFKDLHPSPFGQELYFGAIKKLFTTCFDQSLLINESVNADKGLPKPLQKSNFNNGRYYNPAAAEHNKDWALDNHWMPTDSLQTREGFVNRPMLVATRPGASLSFAFKGNAVGMAIVSGGDAGIVSYTIDNGPVKKTDLYTQWSSFLHLPWYVLLGADLKPGKHILKITTSEDKNEKSRGNACRIVYFLVNQQAN